jgi:hypothetical protein
MAIDNAYCDRVPMLIMGLLACSDSAEIALKKAEGRAESEINAGCSYLCRQSG